MVFHNQYFSTGALKTYKFKPMARIDCKDLVKYLLQSIDRGYIKDQTRISSV